MDLSNLDKKYFIDRYIYNCPFCKIKGAEYEVLTEEPYDWSNDEKAYIYTVKCKRCGKIFLHLSKHQMDISFEKFLKLYDDTGEIKNTRWIEEMLKDDQFDLDKLFFFNWPKPE